MFQLEWRSFPGKAFGQPLGTESKEWPPPHELLGVRQADIDEDFLRFLTDVACWILAWRSSASEQAKASQFAIWTIINYKPFIPHLNARIDVFPGAGQYLAPLIFNVAGT